jgi:hypothetical protein
MLTRKITQTSKVYKDINKKKLFDNVDLGFEFEFFSPLSRKELSEKLAKVLGKTVNWTNHYHGKTPVLPNTFKLEPDYSGGMKTNELITGVMPYNEAIHVMLKVFNFINENGFTNERTGLHINISFKENELDLKEKLQNLNVFKYILNLDEGKIFDLWPSAKSRIQKIYKNSVLNIYPKNKFIAETSIEYANPASPMDFNLPYSKYFGLNFTKLPNNYLEVRYAGGKDYEKKKKEAVELINYMAESLYETLLNNNVYTVNERRKISNFMKNRKAIVLSVKTYENFVRSFPNIHLMIDLRDDPRIVESNYSNLKEALFDLITTGNLESGLINYDTVEKRVQVRDANLKECFSISNLDLVNCFVEGEISKCKLYECKVRSSRILDSVFLDKNDIRYSYLKECSFHRGGENKVELTFIKSKPEHPIYAELKECIVRSGTVGLDSKVDSKTEFIENLTVVGESEK